jgi:type I restriction enzyme R subunit
LPTRQCPGSPAPSPCGHRPTAAARQKIKTKLADGKERTIQHMMATTFWSVDGRPMSAAEFITRLFGELPEFFKDED